MENLIHLISCLKPKEVRMIKDFYKVGHPREDHAKKRLQLFKLILAGKVQNDKQATVMLYQHPSSSALCQLKKRLQHDIMNIFLLSPFLSADKKVVQEELRCHKSLLLGKVLINRGLCQEGVELLEKTSSLAEKCELPNIKLACADTLQSIQGHQYDRSMPHSYEEEINRSLKKFEHLLQAKTSYFSVLQKKSLSVASCFDKLEEKLNESNSTKATYWYSMALILFYIQGRDFVHAKNAALALLPKVTDNCQMISESEQAEFYLLFARILICLGTPLEALHPAQLAVNLFRNSKFGVLTALEVLFFAHFQTCHWQQAEEVLNLANREHFQDNEESTGSWYILKSSLFFIQKKFKESNTCLLSHENLLIDRSVTLIWAKLLELINILEMQDYDWFEYKLESFRKRLYRFGRQKLERIGMLYQLLHSLRKNNYNYQATFIYEQSNVALLRSNDKVAGWDPLSYELIDIGKWFISKLSTGTNAFTFQYESTPDFQSR